MGGGSNGAGGARRERVRRRTSRWSLVARISVLAVLALAASPIAASADPSTSALVVQRDVEAMDCPDEAALHRGIVERLGSDPFVQLTSDGWLVDVWFLRPEPGRRSARILLYDGRRELVGTRYLDSREARCEELASTVTMTLAMVLEAQAPATAPSASGEPRGEDASAGATEVAGAASPPTLEAEPNPVVHAEPEHRTELRPFASVVASLGAGFAPKSVLLVGLGGGLGLGDHVVVGVEGRITSPSSASNATSEARLFLGGGAVAACFRSGRFGVCASCMMGALVAQGSSGLATERSRSFVVYPGLVGTFEQPLRRGLALQVRFELDVAARGVDVRVVGQPLWSSPVVAGAIGLGLVYGKGMRSPTNVSPTMR